MRFIKLKNYNLSEYNYIIETATVLPFKNNKKKLMDKNIFSVQEVVNSRFDENVFYFFDIKQIFIGSILGLVIVYFVRFYSLANNGIKSGYLKINYSIDESAYLLGYSKFKTFKNIHIPYLKNSILLIGI